MRYILAFAAAMITVLILTLLNAFVLKLIIPDFLIGWCSCIVWHTAIKAYVDIEKIEN